MTKTHNTEDRITSSMKQTGVGNCVNCGAEDAERRELHIRDTDYSSVPVCDKCYSAIVDGLE